MVAPLSWDSFQTNESHVPSASQEVDQPSAQLSAQESADQEVQGTDWGQFQTTSTYQGKPDPTANESTWGYLTRFKISNLARMGERALGKLGDIETAARRSLPKGSMGLLGDSLLELMGRESFFPNSEELKNNITFNLTGDYTKPKNKAEARTQEFFADVGSMGRGNGTIRQQLVNKLGIPAAANAAKETVKELGFGEDAGNWSKLAAMTALILLNNVNAPAYAANLMNEGRSGFGPNVMADVPRYTGRINGVARVMLQGDPRSALAQQQIAGIRNDIQQGQTSMQDLMRRYDAINAAKRDRGLFELGKSDRKAAIKSINQVRDAVREEIKDLGGVNPQALQSWENGITAFATIHRSKALTSFAERMLTGPYAKTAVGTLFGVGAFKAPAVAGGATAVAVPLYKSGQVAFRVWNDPNLAKYYWQAMSAAAREDSAAFLANFNKLNDGYEKKYGKLEDNQPE